MFLVLSPDEVVIQVIENEEEFSLVCMNHVLKIAKQEVSENAESRYWAEQNPSIGAVIILRRLLAKLSRYKLVRLE